MASNAENVSIWWRHHGQVITSQRIRGMELLVSLPDTSFWHNTPQFLSIEKRQSAHLLTKMGIYQCCIRSLYPERFRHISHDYISNHWTAIELCFPQITICRHCCVWTLLTLWHGNASRITDHLSGDTTESVMGSLRVFSVVSLNKWFADYLRRHGAPVMSLHLTVCMNVKVNADIYSGDPL